MSENTESAAQAPANQYAKYVGQVVRFHLDEKFVHTFQVEDDDTGEIRTERMEHKSFGAIPVAIDEKGVATLKIVAHAKGTKHLVRQLNKGKPEKEHRAPAYLQKLEGVPCGSQPGYWEP